MSLEVACAFEDGIANQRISIIRKEQQMLGEIDVASSVMQQLQSSQLYSRTISMALVTVPPSMYFEAIF
jgi:hypothetical protein